MIRGVAAVLVVALAGCVADAAPARTGVPAVSSSPAAASLARSHPGIAAERITERQPTSRPAQPVLQVAFRAALIPDHCSDRDLAAPPASDVTLTVLDRSHALPSAYAPSDLVPASGAGFEGPSGTKLVRAVLLDDLAALRHAMEADGLEVVIESAYRSWAAQRATFDLWAERIGQVGALVRSARPGHSEHQLGTALDLTSEAWGDRVGDWARETAEGAWMAAHAWEYGFVMSYPDGTQAETCFGYEPWHYRWVGRAVAAEHRDSPLSLREFLVRYVVP